jgi:GAF domain-containing protein
MIDAVVSEQERLGALDRYDVLDTPREESFDRITRLAKRVFDVPIVAISFIDGHRQWFKSQEGLGSAETTRRDAFCNYAIQQEQALIIPDALADARVAENLSVVGPPYVRFYAGCRFGQWTGMLSGPSASSIRDRGNLMPKPLRRSRTLRRS